MTCDPNVLCQVLVACCLLCWCKIAQSLRTLTFSGMTPDETHPQSYTGLGKESSLLLIILRLLALFVLLIDRVFDRALSLVFVLWVELFNIDSCMHNL